MTQRKKSPYITAQHTYQKKHRLRDRTDIAWFSRLLRHPARKRSGSILTTPKPARGKPGWFSLSLVLQRTCGLVYDLPMHDCSLS